MIISKRTKAIIAVLIMMTLSIIFLVWIRKRSIPSIIPSITPTPVITKPASIPSPFQKPIGETITIKDVTIKNFYQDAININDKGDVLITNTSKYQLVFQQEGERFLISVNESPYELVQEEAEQAMLTTLGVSAEEACWIGTFVSSPYYANPQEAGLIYNPNFCEHHDEGETD